jgi:glyoxalase family protein
MRLEGVHHVTAITGDAPGNLDFYTRVLGLRLVKKSVNQDDPTVYHLFYSDEQGSPGADLTFFEYPGLPPGRAGEGMVHRVLWRLGSDEALDFWADRLAAEGVEARREGESLRFADPEGLEHELRVAQVPDAPLVAEHPEVPAQVALQGFHGVRAYGSRPDGSRPLLEEALGFAPIDGGWEIRGEQRGGFYLVDTPPDARAPGPSTTSPGRRAWTSRRSGGGARSPRARTRRP